MPDDSNLRGGVVVQVIGQVGEARGGNPIYLE